MMKALLCLGGCFVLVMPALPAVSGRQESKPPIVRPGLAAGPVTAVAFSPDGRWLAVGGYRRVWIVDARGESVAMPELAAGPINAVAFSPDGRWLAGAGGAPGKFGEIRLWDVKTRRLARTLRGHRDALYGLAFSPDGRTLAAASYDRLVSLWSVLGGPPRQLKDHIDAVYAVAFSPDGRRVASASGDRTIKVWDVMTGRRIFTLSEAGAEQYTVAFSPDGRRLAAAGADKILRMWDVTATGGKLAHSAFAHEGAVLRVLFSLDGRRLYTTGEDRRIKVWDAIALTERRLLEPQPDWAAALSLDPHGRRLAAGRFDGSVVLYDAADGHRLQAFTPQRPLPTTGSEEGVKAARYQSPVTAVPGRGTERNASKARL